MKRNERGFTLIELLTVVAIIGILATLALSNFSLFKGQAINATAASDARGLAPGADAVSTNLAADTAYPFGPDGGDVAGIPGGRSSPGTIGMAVIGTNHYTIKTYQVAGDLCYTLDNGVMTAASGVCS